MAQGSINLAGTVGIGIQMHLVKSLEEYLFMREQALVPDNVPCIFILCLLNLSDTV